MRDHIGVVGLVALMTLLVGCARSAVEETTLPSPTTQDKGGTNTANSGAARLFTERMIEIDEAVLAWQESDAIEQAHRAAETAANLVVGPNGPGYGDRNSDGAVDGKTTVGLLPGLDGIPEGLALPLAANACVTRDVLGGTWEDPAVEWETMEIAIYEWRTDNNTMPTLGSHPMRIVGWATFTIETDSLDLAHEYADHAKLHVDTALDALQCR